MTGRYVALGSSMAAGPGIRPSAAGAPFRSGRSARNYAHLVAERLNLDLVDVTFSGATTAHVLADRQRSAQPQIEALDGSEDLVTVTNVSEASSALICGGAPRWRSASTWAVVAPENVTSTRSRLSRSATRCG